jgi:hypothetical protein
MNYDKVKILISKNTNWDFKRGSGLEIAGCGLEIVGSGFTVAGFWLLTCNQIVDEQECADTIDECS